MLFRQLTNPLDNQLMLGELLDQPGFGLKLLTVGPSARRIPVQGAHSMEISGPARWLPEHWVMLTTGVRLRARPAEQRRLIADLVEGGIAALGFGVGVIAKQVPRSLLEEAERRSFPVFTVPLEVAFRDIELFVNRSLLSTDLYVLQRIVSMQDYLIDAFNEDPPEPVLLKRLASVLRGAEVALIESDGTVITATGRDAADAWRKVRRESRLHELEHAGRWGVAARVDRASQPAAWLLVLTGGEEGSRQLIKPVTRAAARLLGVPSLARNSAAWRRRRRRRLAAILYDAPGGARGARFHQALADAGLDLAMPCRVALLASSPDGGHTQLSGGELLECVEDLLDQHEVAHVSEQFESTVFALVQDDLDSLETWLEETSTAGAGLRAAVGEPVADLQDVPRSLWGARIALSALERNPDELRVLRYESLDPLTLLLGAPGGSPARSRLATYLAPLADRPQMLTTLESYFEAGLAVPRAARLLGVHPNSLRYRLSRIEDALGMEMSSPHTIALLHMALLDRRLPSAPSDSPAGQAQPDGMTS